MFLAVLTYIKPLEELDALIDQHVRYLDEQYEKEHFIVSGRMVPRTGGVILSSVKTRGEFEKILREDPFYQKGMTTFQIIEFMTTKYAPGFATFIEQA